MVAVKVMRLHPGAKLPAKATPDSAGFDLYASDDWTVAPGIGPVAVPTGLRMEIPKGYEGQVRPRSGLAMKGIKVANAPGTIDSDFRGEVKVLLETTIGYHRVKAGDRIAQIVFAEVPSVELKEEHIEVDTERGKGGFGSTGGR